MSIPRLPSGISWLQVGIAAAITVAGLVAANHALQRMRLIHGLEDYAVKHPERADIANTIASCNRRLIVDVEGCSAQLLARFGPEVLDQMGQMAAEGAFGQAN